MKIFLMRSSLLLSVLVFLATATVATAAKQQQQQQQDENETDTVAPPPPNGKIRVIQSVASDLTYDEHNRLASHAIVFDATSPACHRMTSQFEKLVMFPTEGDRFQLAGLEGSALEQVLGPFPASSSSSPLPSSPPQDDGSEPCRAACIGRGVERSLASHVMPEHVYHSLEPQNASDGKKGGKRSVSLSTWFRDTCMRVEVCLLSYHSPDNHNTIDVYWKRDNGSGEYKHHVNLPYGDRHTRCFHSFLGHEFVAEDSVTGEVIGELTVEHVTVQAWGDSPPSDVRTDSHDYVTEIEATLHHEWKRHKHITRTFSPLGFKEGKLPRDVFASIGAFYYNNAQSIVREEWKSKGVFVNWWETDVLFLQIPWGLKLVYQDRLKSMVEEWAGVAVEQTVMYGLRQYTEGARLLTHVDRPATHAVSLIVNVAQGNLTEPWPVEIQDHADRLHEVILEPGDVVYYESAKCLHARNRPLSGPNAYYVNLFTHYRPVGDDKWYHKPNPEGTPAPVLGERSVQEECRLVKKGLTGTGASGHFLGVVEGVECDNPALGPFVSPELFQVYGPDDMIRWWRYTNPNMDVDLQGQSTATSTTAGMADTGRVDEL